jgi:type I restriction enzyme M protein
MTIRQKFLELLPLLGFQQIGQTWTKSYAQHDDYAISIDFKKEKVLYGPLITLGDLTTTNFAHSENIVVLECVHRLLEKGYKPRSLTLEEKWTLGRAAKGGKADISVRDLDEKVLFIIECKTWGTEYAREKIRMQSTGGQLFSYLRQDRNCRYICLYASTIENGQVRYENAIVRAFDDDKLLEQFDKGDEDIRLFREAKNEEELFAAWKESYACYFHPNGIFDEDVQAYAVELKPLKTKDLRVLSADDGTFIYSQFAEILRHNNISDRENAFNKMISLFLSKIVDENKGENEVLEFQWKEGQDTYEDLQDRLQRLYKVGMRDYLKEEVVYFENDYVDHAFKRHKLAVAKDKMIAMLRALKFFTNNEFAFKEVHNERLFEQNAKVLNEVVQLLQPYRVKYSQKTQFLGNLFELLLNAGVKQSEGQFFTPIPIAAFIVSCLPFAEIIKQRKAKGEVHKLPKIIDYACGSGHFLTEAIEDIQNAAQLNCLPEAADTRWTGEYVFGIERDYRLARVSKIACFMNGSGDANVIHGDGLENHTELGSAASFDALVANPPYSIKDFKQHLHLKHNSLSLVKFLTENSSEIETLFVERIFQLLKPGGLAGVILPSSILSNTGIYTRARELLLQNFNIRGIVELGGNTFSSTNTNTVILFLQRHLNGDHTHFKYRAQAIFEDGQLVDLEFEDDNLLTGYCEQIGIPFDEYKSLLMLNPDGIRLPTAALLMSELFTSYHDNFSTSSEIVKLIASKVFATKPEVERTHDLKQRYLQLVIRREKEKFIYFCLTSSQQVVVVKAGEKDKEKEFLGYEWTKRRGYEGMRHVGKGKLFDKVNPYNPDKASTYIRSNILGIPIGLLPTSIAEHVNIQQLSEMIDFEQIDCDLKIAVDSRAKLPQSSKFPSIRFDKLFSLEYGKALPAKLRKAGAFPVLGSNGIDGRHHTFLITGPGIVVGRKGSAGKVTLVKDDFWPIDTTFWLKYENSSNHPVFLYWLLKWLDLTILVGKKGVGVPGLNRTDVHKSLVPKVPFAVQKVIVRKIEAISESRVDCAQRRLEIMEIALR